MPSVTFVSLDTFKTALRRIRLTVLSHHAIDYDNLDISNSLCALNTFSFRRLYTFQYMCVHAFPVMLAFVEHK